MADRLATMFGLSNQGLTESRMKSIGSKVFIVLTQEIFLEHSIFQTLC